MAIRAKIEVDNSELRKGLKDSEKSASASMKKIANTSKEASGGIGSIISSIKRAGVNIAIVTGFIAVFVKGITSAINFIIKFTSKLDNIAKSAKALNLTTNAFQALDFAGRRAGIGIESIQKIITKVTQNMVKAADGTKDTIDAFSELGISWSELEKQSPEVQLTAIVQAAKQITDLSKRNKILFQLFDRRDVQTINKMINGDFSKLVANAKNMGVIISENDLRMAEAVSDSLSTASQQFTNMVSQWEIIKKAQQTIKEIADTVGKSLNESNGKLADEYKGMFIGIGNAAEELEAKLKQNDKARYDRIEKEIALAAKLAANREITKLENSNLDDPSVQVKLSEEQKEAIRRQQLAIERQKRWFAEVSKVDPRFDANDKNTWVQEKGSLTGDMFDKEKVKADMVNAAIKRITLALDEKRKKHEENLRLLDKQLTAEELIAKIQNDAGSELNDEQKAKVKKALYEYEIQRNKEIIGTIEKQTATLEAEHAIQLALLDGDTKRAEKLKALLKLKEEGVNVTEEEYDANEKNLRQVEREYNKKKAELQKYQGGYDEIKDAEAAIPALEKKLAEYEKIREKLKEDLKKDNNEDETDILTVKLQKTTELINSLQQQLNEKRNLLETDRIKKDKEAYEALEKQVTELEARLGKLKAVQAAQQQVDTTDKQAEEIKQKNLDNHVKDLERENQITQAELQGDLERANTLRMLNELKQLGINIDEEELEKNREKYDALLKQRDLQRELNLQKNFKDQGNSLLTQAMKRAGFAKEAARLEALQNAERIKGAKLTDEEIKKVEKMVDLQFRLNEFGKLDLSRFDTKTNELTARGGFATGALTTDKDTINTEIRNYAKRQADLLSEIKDEIKNGGLI